MSFDFPFVKIVRSSVILLLPLFGRHALEINEVQGNRFNDQSSRSVGGANFVNILNIKNVNNTNYRGYTNVLKIDLKCPENVLKST